MQSGNQIGQKITALMGGLDLLTENNRNGIDSAWRDYQQILPEFGLLYSTSFSKILMLTDIGHMYVAGSIGYSELMNQQVLRYQYPNGQKYTVQSGLRGALQGTKYAHVSSVIELQREAGVLVKPGLLILRVLLELWGKGEDPSVSVYECRKCIMPSRTNSEWPICVHEIIDERRNSSSEDESNQHAKRNIQDWFKFLNQSEIFEISSGRVGLSKTAKDIAPHLAEICKNSEDPETFWIPSDDSYETRASWFSWFGGISIVDQPPTPNSLIENPEYVSGNFVKGTDDQDDDWGFFDFSNPEINLTPVDLDNLGSGSVSAFQGDTAKLLEAMLHGLQKRQAKAILHDQIVKDLGQKLKATGAAISSDSMSIDLLASWSNGVSAMFEVKTVTKRSLQSRIRSAIGQLNEYQYRQILKGNAKSDLIIVVNSHVDNNSWQSSFVTDHMKMGLLCKGPSHYTGYGTQSLASLPYWNSI